MAYTTPAPWLPLWTPVDTAVIKAFADEANDVQVYGFVSRVDKP